MTTTFKLFDLMRVKIGSSPQRPNGLRVKLYAVASESGVNDVTAGRAFVDRYFPQVQRVETAK